ncbi:MurR/RpiR family transcriptional regulator [uncultured Lactobacillus sp.]|uniref:MurR/RpiR family transcriptional regulator n=1 Tax=uncultured Lactobacillus sp. TaxID=153152 RepID=UPI002804205E|nr:MurR/RpiR family transcriptional regulator [uncultured Lactobacillus sp.]
MNIRDRILERYSLLKKSSRIIADAVLDNPNPFVAKSAKELGEYTNTSAASIIRFCKQLGYKGLKEFQIDLAKSIVVEKKAPAPIDMIVKKNDAADEIMTKLRVSITQNLEDLSKTIDVKELKKAVTLIQNANSVYLEGIGASSFPAKDLFYKLIRSGKTVFYNDDVHIALERSYYSTKKDVMICFSYSGLTKEILLAVKQAKMNGTPIIAVTRKSTSPLSKLADVKLLLPKNEMLLRVGAINSTFAEMFISNLLYLCTITNNLPKIKKEMEDTGKLLNELKEGND